MGPVDTIPSSMFFAGLGGSYNTVKLDQYLNPLIGHTNIFDGATLIATGTANGPAVPFHNTQSTFAPEAQVGYLKRIEDKNWLWGGKFSYKYVSLTSTDSGVISPQIGTLTAITGEGVGFSGRATIASVQTEVSHQVNLIPFVGYAFQKSHVYFGVGPSVFDTQTHLNNVTGFADVEGTHADVSGTPANFASSEWMWGGIAQIGMSYFIDPTWFIDVNYSYAMTPHNKSDYFSTFAGTLENGDTKLGTLSGTSTQYYTIQSVGVSINKVFEM